MFCWSTCMQVRCDLVNDYRFQPRPVTADIRQLVVPVNSLLCRHQRPAVLLLYCILGVPCRCHPSWARCSPAVALPVCSSGTASAAVNTHMGLPARHTGRRGSSRGNCHGQLYCRQQHHARPQQQQQHHQHMPSGGSSSVGRSRQGCSRRCSSCWSSLCSCRWRC
jgi:hypothetical protein